MGKTPIAELKRKTKTVRLQAIAQAIKTKRRHIHIMNKQKNMEKQSRARKFLLGGAIIGGLMSVTITLLMDSMYSESMQGTWRDAIAKDLNSLMSLGVSSTSIIVTLTFLAILAILAAFGSFMGFIFSFFLYKFFELLGKK